MSRSTLDRNVDKMFPHLVTFTYDETLIEQENRFFDSVVKKVGESVYSEYELHAQRLHEEGGEEAYHAVNSFVFRSGLCNHIPPQTRLRTRETLRALLSHIGDREEPFTLLDMGCGTGKIAAGLAGYLPKLKTLYAMDVNPDALYRLEQNISELPKKARAKARKTIVPLQADYRCPGSLIGLQGSEPDGVDVALAAYPYQNSLVMTHLMPNFTKDQGIMITCYPANTYHPAAVIQPTLEDIEEFYMQEHNCDSPYDFDLIKRIDYLPYQSIMISEAKKE